MSVIKAATAAIVEELIGDILCNVDECIENAIAPEEKLMIGKITSLAATILSSVEKNQEAIGVLKEANLFCLLEAKRALDTPFPELEEAIKIELDRIEHAPISKMFCYKIDWLGEERGYLLGVCHQGIDSGLEEWFSSTVEKCQNAFFEIDFLSIPGTEPDQLDQIIDFRLGNIARQKGVSVNFLEDYEFQMAAATASLLDMSMNGSCPSLGTKAQAFNRQINEDVHLAQMLARDYYKKGDECNSLALTKSTCSQNGFLIMNFLRNHEWFYRQPKTPFIETMRNLSPSTKERLYNLWQPPKSDSVSMRLNLLDTFRKSAEKSMVAVGVAHLLGNGGLIKLFEKEGFTVTRL